MPHSPAFPTCAHPSRRPAIRPHKKLAPLAALFLSCTLLGTGLRAEEAPAPADELMELSFEELLNTEISAASKFSQRASDAPSAVTVVTAEDIRVYGYRSFADILKSIRGLYVTNDRNYSYLGVRGFARPGDYNSRVLLLLDGYRISDNVYDQAPIGLDFPIDVDLIERVEFIPGPGSSIYGSGAFLGVINVRTKNGADFAPGEIKAEVASADTMRGRVTGGKRFADGGQLLLSATVLDSDGRDLFFPEYDDPSTNNGVAEGLDYERSKNFFAKFSSGGFSADFAHAERNKGIPTASYGQVFNDPRSRTDDERSFINANYAHAWDDHDIEARVAYSDWSYDGTYVFDTPPVSVNRDGARGNWWDTEFKFGTRSFSGHHLVAGAEYHRDDSQDQFSYVEEPRLDYLDDHRSSYRYGVYLQDEITINSQLLINAGVRYDDYVSAGETAVNPRLAAIYKPRPTTSLKLLYGTAFRSPNAYELYYQSVGYKTNPDLKSEEIQTYEFVVEERRPHGLRLAGSVFQYTIKDLISLTTDPADGLLVFDNIDRAETTGAEFEIERIWDAGTRLRTSVSWQQATDADTGERLTNSPSLLANFNAALPVFKGFADAGLEAQYVGSRSTLAGNRAGSYTVFNLTLTTRKLVRNLEVSASIYNLFDREYGDPGSEEHLQDILIQDGRGLRLSGIYRF